MERPQLLQIESTARCNAKCFFCPVGTGLNREVGDMSDELFEKILAEANNLGIGMVLLFLNGEPFIFNRFFDWLQRLRDCEMKTHIFTNGVALSEEKAKQLVSYSDIIELVCFSVPGYNGASHREIMGLNHSKVLENIRQFLSINNGQINCYASMPDINGPIYQDAWKKYWKAIGLRPQVNPNFNWGGRVGKDKAGYTSYCGRLYHMTVLWDGRVSLCCMDGHGEVILGDLNTQTILEVYNSELAKHYRKLHKEGKQRELKLCDVCNMR